MKWREQMTPWTDALRRHGTVREKRWTLDTTKVVESGIVWIEWPLQDPGNVMTEGYTLAHEAVELLALLQQVDCESWEAIVQEQLWADIMPAWIKAFKECTPRRSFTFGCELYVSDRGALYEWGELFLLSGEARTVSPKYTELRNELEERLSHKADNNECMIPVSVWVVQTYPIAGDESSVVLNELLKIASKQFSQHHHRNGSTADRWPRLFHLVEASILIRRQLSTEDFTCVRGLAAFGVAIQELPLWNFDVDHETPPLYAPGLQQLFGTKKRAPCDEAMGHCRRINIDGSISVQALDSVFSALLDSRSVRELSLGTVFSRIRGLPVGYLASTTTRLWQWIGVVLFSSMASNRIQDFTIRSKELSMENVVALTSILQVEDPFAVLFPQKIRSEISVVSASRVWLSSPETSQDSSTATMDGELYGHELRVLGQVQVGGDEWLTVLLPGWGQAWVKRSDVTTAKTTALALDSAESATSTTTVRPIPSLSFQVTLDTDDQNVLALLQVVGHGVRNLDICDMQAAAWISERWLRAVLHACPLVEDLSLTSVAFDSLEMFARIYEPECGSRIKYLTMLDVVEVKDLGSVAQFFDCLAETSHPMAQHLHGLDVEVAEAARLTSHVDASVLCMLEQNGLLRDLRLSAHVPPTDRNVPDSAIHSHHNKPVSYALRNKLAFLSVITSRDDGEKKKKKDDSTSVGECRSTIHLLDNRVVELVFQFAAGCRTRHVEVTFNG